MLFQNCFFNWFTTSTELLFWHLIFLHFTYSHGLNELVSIEILAYMANERLHNFINGGSNSDFPLNFRLGYDQLN